MKKKKKKPVLQKIAGADMLSFTGIMLILLAFFIVLSTMAEEKKTELMKAAQQSFVESLDTYGLSRVMEWRRGIINIERLGDENAYPGVKDMEPLDDGALSTMIEEELNVQYHRVGLNVVIPTPVVFDQDDTRLTIDHERFLRKFIKLVRNRPCKVIIEGHVDTSFTPSKKYRTSWELSASRAASVAEYLHKNGRISFKRLSVIGYGKFRPIIGNEVTKMRKKNNRVNIIISKEI